MVVLDNTGKKRLFSIIKKKKPKLGVLLLSFVPDVVENKVFPIFKLYMRRH